MDSDISSGSLQHEAATVAKKELLTVLIIHPEQLLVEKCSEILKVHHCVVEAAEDGTEGIKKVYELIPDIIITTNTLTGFNGYQVCRLIKSDSVLRKIPIILITEQYPSVDRFWAMKSGVDDFIQKDKVEEDLPGIVQSTIDVYGKMTIEQKQGFQENQQQNPFNVRVRLNQILDQSLMESILMAEFRSFTDLVHDVSLLNYMLFSFLESVLDYDAAAIFYHDYGSVPNLVTFHFGKGLMFSKSQVALLQEEFFAELESSLPCEPFEMKEAVVVGDYSETEENSLAFKTKYYKHIVIGPDLIGTVVFYSFSTVDFEQIFPVKLLEHEFRLIMKLRHLFSKAESMATTDAITKVSNHSHFMSLFQREFKSAKRYNTQLTLVIISINDFRHINAEWGHDCGDSILKHTAQYLAANFRGTDIVARLAGKKLAVLMPQSSSENAYQATQRIQKRFTEQMFEWEGHELRLTFSVGISSITKTTTSVSGMIELAEEALKQARLNSPDNIAIFLG